MKKVRLKGDFIVVATALSTMVSGARLAHGQTQSPGRTIDLTIYKEDFALISEKRPISLQGGHQRLTISDLSKLLDPSSVMFDWIGMTNHPNIVATTYDLGIGSYSKMLTRLNGKQVEMMWPNSNGKPGDTITGKLEATPNGDSYSLRTQDKLLVNPGGTILASADTEVSTQPQLTVELESSTNNQANLGMSYLTRGMSWSTNYVARLQPKSDKIELQCWATVVNSTGIPFPSARVTLMAGSPNRLVDNGIGGEDISGQPVYSGTYAVSSLNVSANSPGGPGGTVASTRNAARITVGESYAYKIPSLASIGQDQMNRVSVLGTRVVPIKRDYSIRLPYLSDSGFAEEEVGQSRHTSAVLSLMFVNDASSKLGVPLPSGVVRVYEKDRDGQERYIGASSIADTSKKEHVSLAMSKVFDVYSSEHVIESKRIRKHLLRKAVEVTLHNEKDTPITIRLVQSFAGQGEPYFESNKSEKIELNTRQWKVLVKAGEDKKVKYILDVRD